jgi:hypothetical protein
MSPRGAEPTDIHQPVFSAARLSHSRDQQGWLDRQVDVRQPPYESKDMPLRQYGFTVTVTGGFCPEELLPLWLLSPP